MIENINLKRHDGESETEYIIRLGEAKDAGLLDMTWGELATVFNNNLRQPGHGYTESAYRKKYAAFRNFKSDNIIRKTESEETKELNLLKEEIQKEKRKLFDQRREYNKLVASDARAEHLTDYLIEAANAINEKYPLVRNVSDVCVGNKEAVVCLSDWHYGLVTDNLWNKYNITICKERIKKFVAYTQVYLREQGIKKLHVLTLGDLANGSIHTSCRVASEEDTCDQLMHVSEILAQVIDQLSECVEEVIVYSCYGNHMRTVQKKEDSIHSDNMEKIVPWWLEQRFKNRDDISIHYSQFKEFTFMKVLGKNIVAVHGDGFKFKEIGVITNTLFSKLFGCSIDYTISGDKHHLEEMSNFGIESILVRSLCGTDNYANDQRLYDRAGQTLIIFNDDYGRECTYHIPLD